MGGKRARVAVHRGGPLEHADSVGPRNAQSGVTVPLRQRRRLVADRRPAKERRWSRGLRAAPTWERRQSGGRQTLKSGLRGLAAERAVLPDLRRAEVARALRCARPSIVLLTLPGAWPERLSARNRVWDLQRCGAQQGDRRLRGGGRARPRGRGDRTARSARGMRAGGSGGTNVAPRGRGDSGSRLQLVHTEADSWPAAPMEPFGTPPERD